MKFRLSVLILWFAFVSNVLAEDADVLYCIELESAGFSGSNRNYDLVRWTPGKFTLKFQHGWKEGKFFENETGVEGYLYESDTEINRWLSECDKIAMWINCNVELDGKFLLNIDTLRFSKTMLSPFGFITGNTNYTSKTSIGTCSKF